MQHAADPRLFRTALVLEDIETVNHWMADRLRDTFAHIQVDQAFNLKQAHQLLKSASHLDTTTVKAKHYDIALIDLGLPDGDGIEIIDYCTEHSAQTITVVVTIFEDDQHLFKAIQQGAQGYLLKDMEESSFAQNLLHIANGESVLSPLFTKKIMQYMRQIGQNSAAKSLPIILPLTRREKEVLACIGRGLSVNDTAQQLAISVHTVSSYIKEIYRKLNISSRAEAVFIALQYGLV